MENNNNFEKTRIKGLEIIVADNYEKMSEYSADLTYNSIKEKPDLLICTATGSTPTMTYDLLAEKYCEDSKGFDKMRIIKLDEWGGGSPRMIPQPVKRICKNT